MPLRKYGRYTIETSREEKVLFPDDDITKGELINYHEQLFDTMAPHLRDRAIVMQRFPDGIDEEGFYHKQVPEHFPDWISTTNVTKRETGDKQALVVCDKKATFAYLADQACITLHSWASRIDRPDYPDRLIFDLDPPGDTFEPVRDAARRLRHLMEALELRSFVQTTGSRGLHLVVPLDASEEFDSVRNFARACADHLAERHPDELTVEQSRQKRGNRLYLDVARNAYAQTAVTPYSVRAIAGAPVATPLDWKELERRDLDARSYTLHNIRQRLAQRTDPWEGMYRYRQGLSRARQRLDRIAEGDEP
ncbi:non-homologous end-joining DNA ligase [Halomonas daqiaonensis]|uniref:Bifunctional non-homologous end joining protein LigD n=1 Tax=Halomonas daqiaonensis TaxID=650850 RepID=A0A1H7S8P6_9GAMM|nr:non-homologous end-joining DNA ligase [Halomonas daqiaonensis]SEL68905.1 bifunctional non-homologous end joining protein LigD [Halomonas daqiaonensis]